MNQNPYPYPPPNSPYGAPGNQPYGAPAPGYPPAGPYAHAGVPTAEDENNLNTLAICHYIYGGFMALGGLIGVVYVVIGIVVAASAMSASPSSGAPPAAIGGIFAFFGGAISLFIWVCAALVVYSGMSIKKRQRRTLSFVMACICCMNVPLGTALGVFTLIVLNKPGVKAIYDRVAYYGA